MDSHARAPRACDPSAHAAKRRMAQHALARNAERSTTSGHDTDGNNCSGTATAARGYQQHQWRICDAAAFFARARERAEHLK
jgi:hypothetical protein